MAISQARPHRKKSGALYRDFRKKRKHETGTVATLTRLGPHVTRTIRIKGDHRKNRVLQSDRANVFDQKNRTYAVVKIKTITENPANRHFVRRNIMTKGSVVETELGKARITSRPGQDGVINAVLI